MLKPALAKCRATASLLREVKDTRRERSAFIGTAVLPRACRRVQSNKDPIKLERVGLINV